jgi:hypothetical protein
MRGTFVEPCRRKPRARERGPAPASSRVSCNVRSWPKAARQLSGVHITEADVRIGRRKVLTGPKADLLWSPKAAVS